MSIEEIIKQKLERLDSVPKGYASGIYDNQKEVMDSLLDSLEQLSRDSNGLIKKTQRNLIIIEDITRDLEKIFNKSDYFTLTREFLNEFDSQAVITDKYFRATFGKFDENTFNLRALEKSKKLAFDALAGNATITTHLYNPVRGILTDAVIAGDSYTKTVRAIRQLVQGGTIASYELEGKLYRYSKQIAFDVFAFADRGYTNNIAEDLGVEWYVYRGGLVEDSREFCKARNGKYFHKKEVEAWGKLKKWDGKIPATDEKTIFIYCGGYLCQHSLLPTSEALVPQDVIERNIKSGNIAA